MPKITKERQEALATFLQVWSDGYMLDDIGPTINCTEADALADLFKASGDDDAAEALLSSHVMGDEDGDDEDHLALAKKIAEEAEVIEAAERCKLDKH